MYENRRGTKVHIVVRIALGVFLLYVAYCCLLFLFQRQILFPRYQIEVPSGLTKKFSGLEEIWLDTSFGRIEAWLLGPAQDHGSQPAPAVIFAHGNAELIDFWPEELNRFTSLGMSVLLVEYPGYGRSEGSPSQRSITETFIAAYDALVARKDVDSSRIVLFGRSLGGGAVCALAEKRPSAALILLSTFTSVQSCASNFLVPGFLILDEFDNLAVIGSYRGPVLVVHGRNDDLIPYEHGVALCQEAQRGEMLTYDCRHNDCPPNWETFWRDMKSFLIQAEIIESVG